MQESNGMFSVIITSGTDLRDLRVTFIMSQFGFDTKAPVASPINLSESSIRCLIENLFEMFLSFKIVLF